MSYRPMVYVQGEWAGKGAIEPTASELIEGEEDI